jgi:hypothetical protein
MLLLESLETALQRADEQLLFNAGTRRIRDLGRNRAASNQEGHRAKEQNSKCDSPHLRILLNNQFQSAGRVSAEQNSRRDVMSF